jgi:hypothetical protein
MGAAVLFEAVLTVLGEVVVWAGRNRHAEHEEDRWLSNLPYARRRAALEIVACAMLADGETSELEQRWIARRAEASGSFVDEMNAALASMRAALASDGAQPRDAALVAERAALFQDLDDLAQIDLQIAALLRGAGQLEPLARLRAALNLPDDRRRSNDATLASLMK